MRAVRTDERVIAMISEQREELSEMFEQTARQALHHITADKLEKSSPRDLGILAGVCVDKHRLLTGQSTSNQAILLKAIFDADQGDAA